jgi:pimeloyl-ACP methyl ester carboxylesterase
MKYEIARKPIIVQFEDQSSFTETYGFVGSQGYVFLEGQLIIPEGVDSKTLFVFMHPASTLNLMPFPAGVAAAGHHVMCCGSRYAKNDTALIMEKVVVDLAEYIRYAKKQLGYEKIVLMGWSGGGSLTLLYQAQALNPTITETPAGDPINIAATNLIPADLVVFIAAHIGRAQILSEWIDPSVKDESEPDDRTVELDLYDSNNPNQPPYSVEYIDRFRAAQRARIEKITANVDQTLAELKAKDGAEVERPFIVHRTMADPRFLDAQVEPSGRKQNWCYLGNPETVNVGPVGIARFTTLRAWLSQWSERSNANGITCAKQIDTPLLLVENQADDATPPSHTQQIFEASASPDKVMRQIEGATHYYKDQPEKLEEAVAIVLDWVGERIEQN